MTQRLNTVDKLLRVFDVLRGGTLLCMAARTAENDGTDNSIAAPTTFGVLPGYNHDR